MFTLHQPGAWKLTYFPSFLNWNEFDFCQEQGEGISGELQVSTQLVTSFNEHTHLLFSASVLIELSIHCQPSYLLAQLPDPFFFLLSVELLANESILPGGDESAVVKSDWGKVIFGQREEHQTAVWWLRGLFYISKLADSGFLRRIKRTILGMLA